MGNYVSDAINIANTNASHARTQIEQLAQELEIVKRHVERLTSLVELSLDLQKPIIDPEPQQRLTTFNEDEMEIIRAKLSKKLEGDSLSLIHI